MDTTLNRQPAHELLHDNPTSRWLAQRYWLVCLRCWANDLGAKRTLASWLSMLIFSSTGLLLVSSDDVGYSSPGYRFLNLFPGGDNGIGAVLVVGALALFFLPRPRSRRFFNGWTSAVYDAVAIVGLLVMTLVMFSITFAVLQAGGRPLASLVLGLVSLAMLCRQIFRSFLS